MGREPVRESLILLVEVRSLVVMLPGWLLPIPSCRSASSIRSAFKARCRWLLTVPSGAPSSLPVSRTVKPSK